MAAPKMQANRQRGRTSGRPPVVARRDNPRAARPADAANAVVELVASEAEAWRDGQWKSSGHDVLTLFCGNEFLRRSAILGTFAIYLRTGTLGGGRQERWPDAKLLPADQMVAVYLSIHAEEIPLAAAMGRLASEAERWARELAQTNEAYCDVRAEDEAQAMRAFARFLRTGQRPKWHVPITDEG